MRRKHVPQRTCVGCGQVKDKRTLIRVLRSTTGEIEVDATGKKGGRGAYLCPRRACWESALRQRRLDHALRTRLTDAEMARLEEFAQTLPVAGEGED